MKTASFFCYDGPGRISIARLTPRAAQPGYRVYRRLAPGPWFNSVPYDEYVVLYEEQLSTLDARRVWDELHSLVAPHEPILLCWERPPLTTKTWCHRTMVANWIGRVLEEQVTELATMVARDVGRR
jgi:hypothetical protein